MRKKGFTIIELLVAMALLVMMVALSSVVFSTAVKAYRTANATTEIMSRMRALTEQLDADLRGLRKEGQFIIVWQPAERVDSKGAIVPNEYISLDRLFFFADVDAQTFNEQPTISGTPKRISSNLARICYIFNQGTLIPSPDPTKHMLPNPQGQKRIFCRTQHLITGDADLPVFPQDLVDFKNNEYVFEYQTLSVGDWWNLPANTREEMLSYIMDVSFQPGFERASPSVDLSNSNTIHNLFSQGIGQFHIQIWRDDLLRWFPEFDPNLDGDFSDSPYPNIGTQLKTSYNVPTPPGVTLTGIINQAGDLDTFNYYNSEQLAQPLNIPFTKALKFTFTIYDSKGIFPEGKTFTHIVYLK